MRNAEKSADVRSFIKEASEKEAIILKTRDNKDLESALVKGREIGGF